MKNQNEIQTVESILFNQKETTHQINLETLSNSASHLQVGGMLKASRPTSHHSFIRWMQQEWEDMANREVIIEPITISKRHANEQVSGDGVRTPSGTPTPVSKLDITRLVSRIGIPSQKVSLGGSEFIPTFAVSYHDKGIEVTFGTNVWACANMNIYGGTRWGTFGNNRIDYATLQTVVKAHMGLYNESFDSSLTLIDKLQDKAVNIDEQRFAVAKLFETACDANLRKKKDSVLNVTQTCRLQEELIKRRDTDEAKTWWDFTQAGTEHLKPSTQDMVSLYPTVASFNDWVCVEAGVSNEIVR